MARIIRLTERDLTRIVKRVIMEQGPYAPGMGPSSNSTTPSGVNPGMKKPNLQPIPNMSMKIGDIYKLTMDSGSHIRFKITKEDSYGGDIGFIGIILGVFGKIEPEDRMKQYGYRSAKVGDPINIDFYNTETTGGVSGFSFYLPKTDGEMESGGGNMSDLKKLN